MKKSIIIFMMMFTIITYSQKKKNGTVYIDHPAITVVEAMQQAMIASDADKVATYLADDFKSFNGVNTNPNNKGRNREDFLKRVSTFKDFVNYASLKRTNGAYPDALEYKDDEDGLWVQTWDSFKGVHSVTGVKLDGPVHRLFRLNEDNKIVSMITYSSTTNGEIGRSFSTRTNGTIYKNHDNINTARKVIRAFENSDFDKAYSYFTDDARFSNSETPRGEALTLTEYKESIKKIRETWDVESFDMNGYPDYLNYEFRNAKVVQSWWTIRLIRKSDGKKFELPILYIHDFNDDGKITRSSAYYSSKVLED
jgi:ketosteroid isomerase-like protein